MFFFKNKTKENKKEMLINKFSKSSAHMKVLQKHCYIYKVKNDAHM